MLEPQSRRLFLESLAPPDGHQLDWAVGTTYSLDLTALLAAPVAFAFSDWQDNVGRPTFEPLALLKAVRQYADQICLFCQAGKIQVPRSYQHLLADLEESIVESNAPLGGSFHSKVWFLRYITDDGTVTYRLLCLSRNLTFDRSWDTMLSLEGQLRDRTNAFGRNRPLGQFVEKLPSMALRKLSPVWQRRLADLAYELCRVEFEVPEPFDNIGFLPLGVDGKENWLFPERVHQVLVVSPFVDDGFVDDVDAHEAPMQLVSRSEQLDRLSPAALAKFEKVWVLDATAEPETVEPDEAVAPDVTESVPGGVQASDVIPPLGLHAKLYVADDGWDAHVLTGSANATTAAFTKNVEFVVELTGKKSRCGVDALLGRPEKGGAKHVACFADLLQPYGIQAAVDAEILADEQFERLVDVLAKSLAASTPHAECEALPTADTFAIAIRATKPRKSPVPPGCLVRARPVSLAAVQLQSVDPASHVWARFEAISLLGLTSFFAFEVVSADGKRSRQFVLNIPLINAPEGRRDHILRHLLSDRNRVLRFLLLLLTDHGVRGFGRFLGTTTDSESASNAVSQFFDSTLFESLMQSLDREPQRIDQVALLIEDLQRTLEGRELLPPDFDRIWGPIWQVRQKQRERQAERSRLKRKSRQS